ncbi:MAG: hypothetical protein ACI4MZ_01315 [Christensenellales bacterium]
MEWDESKHPRDDDGQFTDGNKTHWITTKRDYSNVQGGEGKYLQFDNQDDTINLTKQEWAQYYKILGDEQHGDFVYHTPDGGRAVRLDNKIIFDNGDFEMPIVKYVSSFVNEDAMFDYLKYAFGEKYDR